MHEKTLLSIAERGGYRGAKPPLKLVVDVSQLLMQPTSCWHMAKTLLQRDGICDVEVDFRRFTVSPTYSCTDHRFERWMNVSIVLNLQPRATGAELRHKMNTAMRSLQIDQCDVIYTPSSTIFSNASYEFQQAIEQGRCERWGLVCDSNNAVYPQNHFDAVCHGNHHGPGFVYRTQGGRNGEVNILPWTEQSSSRSQWSIHAVVPDLSSWREHDLRPRSMGSFKEFGQVNFDHDLDWSVIDPSPPRSPTEHGVIIRQLIWESRLRTEYQDAIVVVPESIEALAKYLALVKTGPFAGDQGHDPLLMTKA